MDKLVLDQKGKLEVDDFIKTLSNADPKEAEKFLDEFQSGAGPAWHRFLKGAYNQPITWWIGIIQLQMQLGMWGSKRKAHAQVVATQLGQILLKIKENSNEETLFKAVRYNLKYKKADVIGRFAGGAFTNYASKGGKIGGQKLDKNLGRAINLSNFILAAYGACIKAVATGHKKSEHVIQAILTGNPNGPVPYPRTDNNSISDEEKRIFIAAEEGIYEMNRLSHVSSSPIPIAEFCLRPENVDIKELCK